MRNRGCNGASTLSSPAALSRLSRSEDAIEVAEQHDGKEPVRTDNRSARGAFRDGHHGQVSTLARAGPGPVTLALEASELSPRELAVRFTDKEKYFVSEASVYRLLKAHDLVASPVFTVVKAGEALGAREQTSLLRACSADCCLRPLPRWSSPVASDF
jgi:hypothetical protein